MTRYHFILTLQLPIGSGVGIRTRNGTTDVPPGMGSHAVCQDLIAQLTADDPRWATANILFWSLTPDALPHTQPTTSDTSR
ncbi:hypothetical protein [Streptomyces sp. NPDC047999]|uniref:hypothetical protein n=1 Tax=Streptomyces sp. NPDC047999 TaxID=3365497 RepID=UPI0037147084